MSVLTLRDVSVGFGGPPVLDRIDLRLAHGERVCLVGRNGSGKSTLMKLISGDVAPEDGEIIRQQGLRVARLGQDIPTGLSGSVFDVVAGGLGHEGELLARYHHVSAGLSERHDERLLAELAHIQHELEAMGAWQIRQRVETVLSRLELPVDDDFGALSGGLKRRVMLARALTGEPDLLLLDEPTNHLDIDAIRWLEEFLLNLRGTLLFVTHDRALLQKLATRIVELDRGRLDSWDCDYRTYLQRRQAQLDAESGQQAEFDRKLASEEAWIRQGIKARRTRNEGRVKALEQMRELRRQRRDQLGTARLQTQEAEQSGRLVVETEQVCFSYGERPVLSDFSTTIMRGDRVAVIGPNGAGKSTLLRILLGELAPDSGRVRLGTGLQLGYFDQHRAQLKEQASVLENVADGSDHVVINGKPRHVISYLQDFLFTPERARTPACALSGGERNRLMLARLLAHPCNLLVLDEPTNDLDVETLELLEELLLDFKGTLLLVSHDRAFIDNIATSTLVLEGSGRVGEYIGGYEDWLRQRPEPAAATRPAQAKIPDKKTSDTPPERTARKPGKLSYKEQRELDALPRLIETLEMEQDEIHQNLSDPDFYREDNAAAIGAARDRLQAVETDLARAYERWETLEALATPGG